MTCYGVIHNLSLEEDQASVAVDAFVLVRMLQKDS